MNYLKPHIFPPHAGWLTSEPELEFPVHCPESTVSPVEALSESHQQHLLQAVPRHPQPFHQAVLAVAHGQAKAHICHIVSGEQQPGQAHQGGPAHNQNPHGGCVHDLCEEEAGTHGGSWGMAWGEGVSLHKEGREDVRAVLCRRPTSDQGLDSSDQQKVQRESYGEEKQTWIIIWDSIIGWTSEDLFEFHFSWEAVFKLKCSMSSDFPL